ncbi:MAG: hypothetical protein KKF42_07410 [Actinobacteria bacterium]|nr:hypothetical protein [Actinomycetota bacterium]
MSIRGYGPHSVIVQNRIKSRKNGQNFYVPDGPAILIESCHVQSVREWATAEEDYAMGLSLLSMNRIFTRTWPGTVDSLVYFRGGEYETVGTPQHMDGSRLTEHWVITIKWLGDRPAPEIPAGDPNG